MRQIVLAKEGYLFNDESKKLEKYEFIKAEFCLNPKTPIRYYCKLAGVDTVIETLNLAVYKDEEGFKGGNPCLSCSPVSSYTLHRVLPHGSDYTTWVFEDGEAKLISALDISLTYENGTVRITSGEKYHGCKADVFKYNDYIVKEADGTERVVVSPATKMALNDVQKSLVDKFKSLVGEMRKENMVFIYDASYGRVEIVNLANIKSKSFAIDYRDRTDDDGKIDVSEFTIDAGISCPYTNDEDCIFIKFE